ncbi:XK-related protein 6 [Copidosoma floridanum]|uniref:XK-related protein 6 n=1 Tax=Copidosoma floridanum TaxID=29053 RepID=UPI0006C9B575|nr:XK-related protein 6 [Copidosoma floridanum]
MELEEKSVIIPLEPARDSSDLTEDRNSKQRDVTDIPPKSSKITNCDLFFLILSIITHCTDVGVDINIVFQYYFHNKLNKLLLTIALILIPSLINTLVSLQMYQQDEDEDQQKNERIKKQSVCIKMCKKIGRFFGIVLTILFQFTMAQRCIYSLKYALQSRYYKKKGDRVGQRRYFIKMLKEEQDIALLRVLECFIEAAPQQILQLSLFVHDYHGEFSIISVHQVISIISSFISLAWAMVSYHRSVRLAQVDKKNIDIIGSVFQFIWYFSITSSRIATVSAAAVYSSTFVVGACSIHWLVMTVWTIIESHGLITFCHNKNRPPHMSLTIIERVKSTLFSCVLGFVYIFIYLNPEDTSTFYRHLFYYVICFFENVSASVLILVTKLPADIDIAKYHYMLSASCIIPFILGVIFMIIYYLKYHPSMKHITLHFWRLLKGRYHK